MRDERRSQRLTAAPFLRHIIRRLRLIIPSIHPLREIARVDRIAIRQETLPFPLTRGPIKCPLFCILDSRKRIAAHDPLLA
jgi:hypothetical protein